MKQHSENFKKILKTFQSPRFLFIFLALWAAIVLLSGIRYGDLSGYDDAAYAHEAKVMLQSGDWWTLSFNGNPDFDKPPLFIWLLAISFKIFGISDFAAKIPGVVLGWATIVTVYFLTREISTDEAEDERRWLAVLAMFCLATTQYFLKYASHAMTDVPFTFFFSLAIYFYVRGLKNNAFLLASGIAAGLAMMIRSPMGFFPLVIILLHLVFTRRFKLLFSFYFAGLILFALIIPAAWYITEYRLFGEMFINRHFANFLAHSVSSDTRTAWQDFLWYFEYVFLIVRLYLPWFPLMFYGLFLSLRKWREKSVSVESLLLIWLLVVFVPFSLAGSKVLRYILPIFPLFSIYSAYSLKKILAPKYLPVFARSMVFLLILGGIFIVAFPHYKQRAEDMRVLAPVSDSATETDEKVILYTSGELQWNYQTQLMWYGNRDTILFKDTKDIENLLTEKRQLVVIMDKSSFSTFTKQINSQAIILGESEKFICFHLVN